LTIGLDFDRIAPYYIAELVEDVCFDENPIGWTVVFSVPLGITVVNF